LTGFAGEIGRGDHLHATARLTPKKLLRRQGFAVTARNVDAYSRWLEGIPSKHGERILDIHYIEQGVGAWGGAHCYGTAPFAFNVMPMNQRRVLEAMIRLPPDYRRARRLVTDMVRLGWPELEGLPFGRPPGLVGQAEGVARVARKLGEGHVVRKVWTAARR
jgi:hypothetical protein